MMDREEVFTVPPIVSSVAALVLLKKPNIAVIMSDIIAYKDSIIANAYV